MHNSNSYDIRIEKCVRKNTHVQMLGGMYKLGGKIEEKPSFLSFRTKLIEYMYQII